MSSPFPADSKLQKPVCVFCGSSPGNSSIYTAAAESVGQALAKEHIPVVYGGGRRGIMGVVSNSTLKSGGYVHGVLPHALLERASEYTPSPGSAPSNPNATRGITSAKSKEGAGIDLLEENFDGRLTLEVVGSMHERKAKMALLSTGGFIVLPGGYGTFEEVLEMITWNQLGIHRLPIIILNIGNFYASLLALFHKAVDAGFINPQNLSLMRVIDLEGGESANADETKVNEWGTAALKALKAWTIEEGAGYGFKWRGKAGTDGGEEQLESSAVVLNEQSSLEPTSSQPEIPALFTTLRFTSPTSSQPTIPIERKHIPLLDRHIGRLREAHSYFSKRDGKSIWGDWLGDEVVWDGLRTELEKVENVTRGDWRVRVLVRPSGALEVQVVPAPAGGPFNPLPSEQRSTFRRPLMLDPENTDLSGSEKEKDYRLYKTVRRIVYDSASERAGDSFLPISAALHPDLSHPEILLHTSERILETSTSNIAIHVPMTDHSQPQWVTPRLDIFQAPFLSGVMRAHLIDIGVLKEGDVSLEDFLRVMNEGGRVIGFNGLRGVWEAEVV